MTTQAIIDAIKRNIDEGVAIVEDALDHDKISPSELARRANQFVSLGDQAKRSAETFYATAGRFLWHLKQCKPAGISFADYLQESGAKVGRRRADELIAIWEKRTTLDASRERNRIANRNLRGRDGDSSTFSKDGSASHDAKPIIDDIEENEREQAEFEAEIEPQHRRAAFLLRADQAAAFAFYSGPVDREILQAARAPMQAWRKLVTTLNGRQRK